MGSYEAMSDTALGNDMQTLLEQSGWVRELARRLASGADADDVEQATWLAALRGGGRRGPVRDWLGTVARNFARQERRARSRRSEHEQRGARAEATPATVDLLARAELQRKLVGAVMQLDEPYRTAVLLRYFENLPPREIAARLNVPVATVRTRLARAIERLRERLDHEHDGARDVWVQALAPLWPRTPPLSPGLGALIALNAKIVVACVVLGAVGALAWWMSGAGPTAAQGDETLASRPSAQAASTASSGAASAAAPIDVQRAAADAANPLASVVRQAPAPAAPVVDPSLRITGRVVDPSGVGLGDVRVVVRSEETQSQASELSAITGRDGTFAFEAGPTSGGLTSASRQFTTILGTSFSTAVRADLTLVVAPRIEVAGVVVDESGAPVEGAQLAVEPPDDLRARLDVVLDRAQPQSWTTSSQSDGSFEIDGAPQIEGARLIVAADGFLTWRGPAPQHTDAVLRIVLRSARAADGYLRGVVVDRAAQPIAGAFVAFGVDTQRTASDGAFAFQIDDPQSFSRRVGTKPRKVTAIAAGFALAVFEPPAEHGEPAWPSHVRLVLDQPSLSLAGRVVDASDAPLAGVRVYVSDPTLLGIVDGRAASAETLFAPGEGVWRYVESDERGRFELDGLLDREYVVRAHDPRTLLRTDSEPVHAGRSGVELRLPTDRLYPRVAGRVLSLGGTPVVGAEVFAMCDALQIKYEGQIVSTAHDARDSVTTDEQGRFELENVPMSLAYLRVNGATVLPVEYGRYVEGDRRFTNSGVRELPRERITDLEIRVETRCHMQVELSITDLADSLAVLDASGRELTLNLFEATGRRDAPRQPLHNGRSAMLAVPESGRTLVLFKEGVEVTRSGIELDPSKPTTIRR